MKKRQKLGKKIGHNINEVMPVNQVHDIEAKLQKLAVLAIYSGKYWLFYEVHYSKIWPKLLLLPVCLNYVRSTFYLDI